MKTNLIVYDISMTASASIFKQSLFWSDVDLCSTRVFDHVRIIVMVDL